jgi:23S rRNA (uracil1939-C5)-methyltransferase
VGRTVVAIELDRDAVATFRDRLPSPSSAIVGRVEDHLRASLPADVVLLNPPRAGVDARVTAALEEAATAPSAIVYVSCDPATLARDVARLPRYRVASVRAYDMFPQTAHVETVCELVPEAA